MKAIIIIGLATIVAIFAVAVFVKTAAAETGIQNRKCVAIIDHGEHREKVASVIATKFPHVRIVFHGSSETRLEFISALKTRSPCNVVNISHAAYHVSWLLKTEGILLQEDVQYVIAAGNNTLTQSMYYRNFMRVPPMEFPGGRSVTIVTGTPDSGSMDCTAVKKTTSHVCVMLEEYGGGIATYMESVISGSSFAAPIVAAMLLREGTLPPYT